MSLLERIVTTVDAINLTIGRAVAWLTLIMALLQFVIVIMRYVFAIGFIPMQESVWYLHGILFMAAAGFTLLHDGHVRVDVLYRGAAPGKKALVDLVGAMACLLPLCVLTLWLSRGYVLNSWHILERSTETSGLPLIFLLKTVIWVFALLLGLQAISLAARAARYLKGETSDYSAGLQAPSGD